MTEAPPNLRSKLRQMLAPKPTADVVTSPFDSYRRSPAAHREAARRDGVSVQHFDAKNPPPAGEDIGSGALTAHKIERQLAAQRAEREAVQHRAAQRRAEHARYLAGHGDDRV